MALSNLCFGVELELLLSPRNIPEHTEFRKTLLANGWKDHQTSAPTRSFGARETNRIALRQAIVERLQAEAGIPAQTQDDFNRYDAWTVSGEALDEPSSYWGAEITSRILTTDEDWQAELGKVFGILSKYCRILLTWDCSMHVHVSPDRLRSFSDAELQGLCKGLCYLDEATTAALPGERKENHWAPRNLKVQGDGIFFQDLKVIQKTYEDVPTGSWGPLFRLLDTIQAVDVCKTIQHNNKAAGWNFLNICTSDGHGTVEFRRPPGADSARKAIHWTAIVLGLFSESLAFDWSSGGFDDKFSQPGVEDLRKFVASGLQKLGSNCEGALVEEWVVEDHSVAMSDDEKEAVIDKWIDENNRLEQEWLAQGFKLEDPWAVWSNDDERSSDGGSDSGWSTNEDGDVDMTWEEHSNDWDNCSPVGCSPSPKW